MGDTKETVGDTKRRVMMGHENFDDMQARYVQVKASGDDMDDPKLYVDSKPGRPPK